MKELPLYRALSPFECAYLGGAPLYPPFAIQLWIEAATLPTEAELRRALEAAAAVNPGARLVPVGRAWRDTGLAPRLRRLPGNEAASLAHPLFREPFTFESPPIELVAWEGAGLVFRCSHALMDARGLWFFVEEVFRSLRGEAPLGTNFHRAERDYLLALRHPGSRPWPKPDRLSPLAAEGARDPARFVWARRSLRGDFPAAGPRLAWALARLSFARGDSARLMVPVDLRQLDSSVRTTANFSNPLFFDLPRGTSWTEFYRMALEAFARHDERATDPVDAVFPYLPKALLGWVHRQLHSRQVRGGRYMLSGTTSHVGKLPLAAVTCPGFTPRGLFLLPFDAPSSALTLVTVQHEHGLEIAASTPAGPGVEKALTAALDRIQTELEAPLEAAEELADDDEHGHHHAHDHAQYTPIEGERVALGAGDTVLARIAESAARFPESTTAVGQGELRLSYRELLALAAGFERALREKGVRPGDRVAVLGARSSALVAALLGIHAAGAAFVPLDPEWPEGRIGLVLGDCAPTCLVTEERFAHLHRSPVLFGGVAPASEPLSVPAARADAPAYVLYTSGSTGRPKGVVVGQGSFLNYVRWAVGAYGEGLTFPFFTSLAFDLTLTSLFVPLASGGAVRVVAENEPLSAAAAILADGNVNAVKLTPSHLRILRELGLGRSALKILVVGGEALPAALTAEVVAQTNGRAAIFNEYGPTEATVGCVVHRFEPARALDRDSRAVPIGLPIANTEILVLDETASLLPPGVPGELYISGACLALGYLARPEEEARFSPHPFRSGERVYRTGDRGVLGDDGLLHYRGRLDKQVKVLGHRVEPGEVEAAIELTGLCREVAVTGEGGRLTAYVSWKRAGDANAERLRLALGELLPRALVPSRIVALERLPLTANGKVNRAQLPSAELDPASEGASEGTSEEAPAGSLEARLAALAAGLLKDGPRTLPLDRSLLELGFDSLQMALLLSQAASAHLGERERGRLFAGLGGFLRAPTLRALAEHLRALGGG